jgi:hypothetical protein
MTADRSVSASFTLNNHTLSLSAGTGGAVSGGGSYGYGASANITATANAGYSFSGWSGSGVTDSSAATTAVSMTADRSVSASFTLNNHTLSLSAGTGGTVSGGGNYGYGTSANITATANTGYTFSGWSGVGVTDTDAVSTTVSMTADRSVSADFELLTAELSFKSPTNGRLTGDGEYSLYSVVSINAFPDNGYRFEKWIGSGIADVLSASTTVDLNFTNEIEAVFSLKPINSFNLSIISNPVQGGTTTGSGNFEENKTIVVTATPNIGYSFVEWVGEDFTDRNSTLALTLNNDSNLSAIFELKKYSLTLFETTGGKTSGSGTYDHGTTAKITALPDDGFRFKEWLGNGISDPYSQATLIEIEGDKNFTASFERKKHQLIVSATTGGIATGSGNFDYGETVTVLAISDAGFKFVSWNGLEGNASAESSVFMDDNKTVEAIFEKITLSSSSSTVSLGSNWFEHWFGYFYEDPSGWAYHTEFGWIYLAVQNDGSIWFWTENFSWLWVDESTRGKNLYWKEDEKSWVYFPLINPSNKIYFSYNNQQWIEQNLPTSNR